ncbi:sulfur carrier protein ThiS [Nocardioides sp.]|jgi:sulfur carrier protein|uniref:sulfur carrier protein ThiS n=1 Tax=Nocardioides sp. TaxID=35761 RepID=UPI002BDB7A6C|nr:sulfur carrier protein ThiS [Nocardioides sp.]HVX53727.1 sulfur carrier protein ThiS [Nocardioides sp.]
MTIILNGEPAPFEGSVADLVEQRFADRRLGGVAVAVNRGVVPRGSWESHRLVAGDRVEIVTAVQGG